MMRAVVASVVACALASVVSHSASVIAQAPSSPTFSKDVLPIFQKHCQSCHRPGQIAPFSMLTYESTRPWARSIKTKVESRQLGYNPAKPIRVPKGTKLVVSAHFDNSAGNKFNPDPTRTVYMGTMTREEMMFPFFSLVVDKSVDHKKIIKGRLAAQAGA